MTRTVALASVACTVCFVSFVGHFVGTAIWDYLHPSRFAIHRNDPSFLAQGLILAVGVIYKWPRWVIVTLGLVIPFGWFVVAVSNEWSSLRVLDSVEVLASAKRESVAAWATVIAPAAALSTGWALVARNRAPTNASQLTKPGQATELRG